MTLENFSNVDWPRALCSVCGGATIPHLVFQNLPASAAHLSDQPASMVGSCTFIAGQCSACDHTQNNHWLDWAARGILPGIYGHSDYRLKTAVSPAMSQNLRDILAWITEHLGWDLRGLKVLEIGSGSGELARALSDQGVNMVTIDPSVLDYDHRGIRHISAEFNSDFTEGNFDLIIARHVLEHCEYPGQFLRLVAHRLKPQGKFYVECPNGKIALDRFRPLDYFIDHVQHFSPNSLTRLLRDSGFTVQQARTWLDDNNLAVLSGRGQEAHMNWPVDSLEMTNKIGRAVKSFQRKLKEIESTDRIIIYGAGAHATTLVSQLSDSARSRITAVWDRDTNKHGLYLPGVSVPISGIGQAPADLIVNTAVLYPREVAAYLKDQLGITIPILQLTHTPELSKLPPAEGRD